MRERRTGRRAPRMLALCLMTLLLVLGILLPGAAVMAADDKGVSDMSLYQRASELTRVFGTALAPGADSELLQVIEGNDDSDLLTAGNAGGFLGYADIMSDDDGVIGWLMSSYTNASAAVSYDQLENLVASRSTADAGFNNPFFQYAGYGEALTKMGLATPIRGMSMGTAMASVGTGIMIAVYLLASAAPFIFRSALFLLDALNPFKLFMTVIDGTAAMELGMLSDVAAYVGGLYEAVISLSLLVLLPMMLVLAALAILMFKSSAMKTISRYALRVFMIFAGLPLIGATYTGIVEDLNANVETGADYANYLVMSSYVDFEGWVTSTRLAPPVKNTISNPRTASGDTVESMSIANRAMVLEINGLRAGNQVALNVSSRYDTEAGVGGMFEVGGERMNIDDSTSYYANEDGFRATMGLLGRHMSMDSYSGSQYDGEVSGRVQRLRSASANSTDGDIVKMFSLTSHENRTWKQRSWFNDDDMADFMEPVEWSNAAGLFTHGAAVNDSFKFGNYTYNIYNGGSLTSNGTGSIYNTDVAVYPNKPGTEDLGLSPIGSGEQGVVGGLSPIAMYNFLNTTFSDTGMIVFSPDRTTSDTSRDSYASVSFAGDGISSLMLWLENVVVMLSMALLSISYGAMMLVAAVKNIPRVLTGVFGTALGSMAAITKLLISVSVMLIQILGMIFLYTLSENILMAILLNFNDVTSSVSEFFNAGSVALEFARGLITVLVTAIVTVLLIKNMNVFREMMEEIVTTAITRVMGLLDTSTGGKGLDAAAMSGGRVGSDGKLTQDAKDKDAKGLMGMGNALAAGGIVGGVAGLMGAAHDVEARREQARQEKDGKDYKKPNALKALKSRGTVFSDLAGAKVKDLAKTGGGALVGMDIKGKSYDRELAAKDQSIRSIPHRHDDDDATGEAGETTQKQALDENGEVIRDENGNALDENGNVISGASPVAQRMGGLAAMKDTDGTYLDADGNTFTDEAGNAFREDERGFLVDEDGNFVDIDKDGVMKPLSEIPGHSGKPIMAIMAAKQLGMKRYDPEKFEAMKSVQDSSHYGLDKDGNVVGANGQPMMAKAGKAGLGKAPVTLDGDGFVTDKDGNRVNAADMKGKIDPRGFEEVTDPETGDTHLRHKGDAAMRTDLAGKADSNNLTEMASQSNRANAVAKRANARVSEMKANGAPPYAIRQAERFANKANQTAQASQQRFNKAMVAEGKNPQSTAGKRVTKDQVATAASHATSVKAALGNENKKLQALQQAGAPAKEIQRQAQKVESARVEAQQAETIAEDTKVANATGRSYGEVSQASQKLQRAETVFANKQASYQQAVQQKAPKEVIQKRERDMNDASAILMNATSEKARTTLPPSGSPAQVDQATARYVQAKQQHTEAATRVQQLQNIGSPASVKQAQVVERNADAQVQAARSNIKQAEARVEQLQQAGAPNSVVQGAKRDVAKARTQTQEAQAVYGRAYKQRVEAEKAIPPKEQIAQAKKAQVTAARNLRKAQQQKEVVSNPVGWKNGGQKVNMASTPQVSQAKSYAALTSAGISNYDDYSKRVTEQSSKVQKTQSQLQQSKQRLAAMRSTNRPPQIIREAEKQVHQLSNQAKTQHSQLADLKQNAQGLLKTGKFQPAFANRPIRKNGMVIGKQLALLNNTQTVLDKLAYQESVGTLTEAGRHQMKVLTSQSATTRRDLVAAGIREDVLTDKASINHTMGQMQQSWDEFISGNSSETN